MFSKTCQTNNNKIFYKLFCRVCDILHLCLALTLHFSVIFYFIASYNNVVCILSSSCDITITPCSVRRSCRCVTQKCGPRAKPQAPLWVSLYHRARTAHGCYQQPLCYTALLVISIYIHLYLVISSYIPLYPVISNYIQMYPVISRYIQLYPVKSSYIQLYPVISSYLQL